MRIGGEEVDLVDGTLDVHGVSTDREHSEIAATCIVAEIARVVVVVRARHLRPGADKCTSRSSSRKYTSMVTDFVASNLVEPLVVALVFGVVGVALVAVGVCCFGKAPKRI